MVDPHAKVIGTGLLFEDLNKDREILVLQRKRTRHTNSGKTEQEYQFHNTLGAGSNQNYGAEMMR